MIALDILNQIYRTWGNNGKHTKADIFALEYGLDIDKQCTLNSLFGIFHGKVKDDIYTYYYWTSDTSIGSIYNYSGKARYRKFRELAHCCRVNYNIRTGKAEVTRVRWNGKCAENAGRRL